MKSKATLSLISTLLLIVPVTTKAESTQSTASPSQLYSAPSGSSFQNATFSQGGIDSATTSSGSASALISTPATAISVSSGPTDAPKVVKKSKNSYVAYLYGLMAFSIIGFITTFRSPRATKTAPSAEEPMLLEKPKKQKKQRRNKKHHR